MNFGLGRSAPRGQDERLLSGNRRYTGDIDPPGQLRAVLARSPCPHAAVIGIDGQAALDAPGVLAVLDALAQAGVTDLHMPASRHRVWQAIRDAGGG